jgi:hypothetical protein
MSSNASAATSSGKRCDSFVPKQNTSPWLQIYLWAGDIGNPLISYEMAWTIQLLSCGLTLPFLACGVQR